MWGNVLQAIASVGEGTFREQELVLGIVGAYHARVDTGKHGGKADGAVSGGDIDSLISDKRTPQNLLWALKRVRKDDVLSGMVVNYTAESCGAIGWVFTNISGGDCDFSWKKSGVEAFSIAAGALVCAGTAGAGCGFGAMVIAGGVSGGLSGAGDYLVDVSDGKRELDLWDLAVSTGTGTAIGGVGGAAFFGAGKGLSAAWGKFVSTRTAAPLADDIASTATKGTRTLYRADTRGPGEIFGPGFEPKGNNLDLWEHVTQNPSNSGFVSTSKTLEGASGLDVGDPAYIYRLHADVIDVNAKFGSRSPFPWEHEVAVPGSVPSCNIIGCTNPQGQWISNPNYSGGR